MKNKKCSWSSEKEDSELVVQRFSGCVSFVIFFAINCETDDCC